MHGADDKAAPRRAEHLDKDLSRRRFHGRIAVAMQSRSHLVERGGVEFEIALGAQVVDQQLTAAGEVGGERDGSAVVARGDHRIENAPLHSTRSTKIWILPPQARPTSQAWSLVMPKSSSRGLPSRITSSASVTTAPSTQPPETEPTIAPLSSTASLAPTGRGEEPQVLTTVATATPDPASRQRATWSRICIVSLMLPSLYRRP